MWCSLNYHSCYSQTNNQFNPLELKLRLMIPTLEARYEVDKLPLTLGLDGMLTGSIPSHPIPNLRPLSWLQIQRSEAGLQYYV